MRSWWACSFGVRLGFNTGSALVAWVQTCEGDSGVYYNLFPWGTSVGRGVGIGFFLVRAHVTHFLAFVFVGLVFLDRPVTGIFGHGIAWHVFHYLLLFQFPFCAIKSKFCFSLFPAFCTLY